ncbi:MAG TPA: hypothetical protein VJU59_09115 [Paraburkholderia sp.]|uniref:hypothetical protein n=1 Tax=Paraburkholderia sp. TaxID=1926495 RepID=UPI002B4A7643|nr:hypothetical protein [Paraburkholderia sp.]HKR39824.1 hypothetical protein [Paraburkholderia sp.]
MKKAQIEAARNFAKELGLSKEADRRTVAASHSIFRTLVDHLRIENEAEREELGTWISEAIRDHLSKKGHAEYSQFLRGYAVAKSNR